MTQAFSDACVQFRWSCTGIHIHEVKSAWSNSNCSKNREKGYEEKIFNPIWMRGCGDNGEGNQRDKIWNFLAILPTDTPVAWTFRYINNTLHLAQKYSKIFVRRNYLFWKATSFPRTRVEENYTYCELQEKIISRDKYMRIFLHQMEAIVFIILQIFFATSEIFQSVICQSRKLWILLNEYIFFDTFLIEGLLNRVELGWNRGQKFQWA